MLTTQCPFTYFGFPKQFSIDKNSLKTKYYELQHQQHPDRGGCKELAQVTNTFYQTLSNDVKRANYLMKECKQQKCIKSRLHEQLDIGQQRDYLVRERNEKNLVDFLAKLKSYRDTELQRFQELFQSKKLNEAYESLGHINFLEQQRQQVVEELGIIRE